jgi:hypothetical protein
MIGQFVGLLGIVALLWFLRREHARYEHIQRLRDVEYRQERGVQQNLRNAVHTGDVFAAPVNAPVYPLEFARRRRANHDDRPAA